MRFPFLSFLTKKPSHRPPFGEVHFYFDGDTASFRFLDNEGNDMAVSGGSTTTETALATPNTLVLRDSNGASRLEQLITSTTRAGQAAITGTSSQGNGVNGNSSHAGSYGISGYNSSSGTGVVGSSASGTGVSAFSTAGTYHATFGATSGDDRSAVERVRGWFVWFFGAYTGRLKTSDITANRDWTLPDIGGKVVVATDAEYADDSAAAIGGVAIGEHYFTGTKFRTRMS